MTEKDDNFALYLLRNDDASSGSNASDPGYILSNRNTRYSIGSLDLADATAAEDEAERFLWYLHRQSIDTGRSDSLGSMSDMLSVDEDLGKLNIEASSTTNEISYATLISDTPTHIYDLQNQHALHSSHTNTNTTDIHNNNTDSNTPNSYKSNDSDGLPSKLSLTEATQITSSNNISQTTTTNEFDRTCSHNVVAIDTDLVLSHSSDNGEQKILGFDSNNNNNVTTTSVNELSLNSISSIGGDDNNNIVRKNFTSEGITVEQTVNQQLNRSNSSQLYFDDRSFEKNSNNNEHVNYNNNFSESTTQPLRTNNVQFNNSNNLNNSHSSNSISSSTSSNSNINLNNNSKNYYQQQQQRVGSDGLVYQSDPPVHYRHSNSELNFLREQNIQLQQQCHKNRYSIGGTNTIEDFRLFRQQKAKNMERNLMRTEHYTNGGSYQSNSSNIKNVGTRYRSQEDLSRNTYDVSSSNSRGYETTYRQLSRYASQEQLNRRKADYEGNTAHHSQTEYFKVAPMQRDIIPPQAQQQHQHQQQQGAVGVNAVDLRQHQGQLRDQAARSNFERYLRGSAVRHQNTIDNVDSINIKRNSLAYEEHVDIGYGGSGSTSPNQGDNVMMTSDQLSSRSNSINSHHSHASSAIASVDSGVRMSFVGQHNSLVVVAIDFGTTFSGYAFSFTRDANSIHMMRRWEGGDPGVTNQKTPTTLLLKPDGSFHSFGFGARDFYHDLDASDAKKWMYFDKFKMSLHSNKDLHTGYEIKAANGRMFPALKVFSHALKFFKDHVLAELSDQSTAKLTEEDITWVLTVPAIWRQPAKQFMRTAAYEAGIASLDHPDRLLIALEPEAASIFCRKLRIRDCVIEDDLKAKAGDDSLISEDFEGVTQYIVVDCGGGTVDLTVHELDVTNGTLRELHKGSGGPSGATGVDREFEHLLKRIFDGEFIERFKVKRPAAWVDLMISFEAKKRTARFDNTSPLNISLPFSFIEYHKKHRKCSVENAVKKFKNPDIKWSSQGMLRFSATIMQTLFEPVVHEVIAHIKNLLFKASLQKVEFLFLVGGFAESPLLQHAIRTALEGRVRVIIPNDVGLAILKGAVLFGLDPTVIRIRRATQTYGVGVLNKFDPLKHDQSKRVVKDGIVWCKDIFDKFVNVDDSVGIGDRVTRSYAPARSKQKSTVINIYCTENTNVLYTTDKGVSRCGKLRMEMPEINPEDIPLDKRGKPRELQATMLFGDTEVKVAAVDVLSGRAARATIDFLNY